MTDQEKIAYLEQALREKDHELMRARQEFSGQIAANNLGDASLRHRIELAEQELGFMRQQLADKDAEIDRLTKVVDALQAAITTLNGSGAGAEHNKPPVHIVRCELGALICGSGGI